MKILAVGSAVLPEANKQSQVDHWRIYRPMRELAKHTDWEIEHSPTFIPSWSEHVGKEQFTPEELEAAFENLAKYDIIFSSYHPDPSAWTLLQVLKRRKNVDFIMDCDDDMFAINPDNPFWTKMTHEKVYWMQRMIANNPWLCTPSPVLADRFRQRRDLPNDTVEVIPNFIADIYQHPPFDNGDKIIIGYMGGASHYADIHESGVLPALERIMHENKSIHFKAIGMLVEHYLPRARYTFEGGKRGTDFFSEIYPNMNFDIGIAPLVDNIFNQGKSNIKWQEMTRAGTALIASDQGPYKSLKNGYNALLVKDNTPEMWYQALKTLVDNPKKRQQLVKNAQLDVKMQWTLEKNWVKYKEFFERVRNSNADNTTKQGIRARKARTS